MKAYTPFLIILNLLRRFNLDAGMREYGDSDELHTWSVNGVFDQAPSRVNHLKNKPQEARYFPGVRSYVEVKENGIGLLDHDMVWKMRDFLKEGKKK